MLQGYNSALNRTFTQIHISGLRQLLQAEAVTSLLAHFCNFSGAHLWDDGDRLPWTWSKVEKAMSQL